MLMTLQTLIPGYEGGLGFESQFTYVLEQISHNLQVDRYGLHQHINRIPARSFLIDAK